MAPATGQKIAYLICFAVISISVTGYYIGLQAPMNPAFQTDGVQPMESGTHVDHDNPISNGVMPATAYAEMGNVTRERSRIRPAHLTELKSDIDPMAVVEIIPGQKEQALARRNINRAFNGAPPTIPHPIDPMSTQSCVACHADGHKTESLRIPKMSHTYMTNCTQCHIEQTPQHIPASLFRPNSFVGLPAPNGGPRAFEGAPPQIPHSTWMRTDCISCHGPTGLQGLRSTHPWRTSCQQCHAPSSLLDQTELDFPPKFLPPPTLVPSSEPLK